MNPALRAFSKVAAMQKDATFTTDSSKRKPSKLNKLATSALISYTFIKTQIYRFPSPAPHTKKGKNQTQVFKGVPRSTTDPSTASERPSGAGKIDRDFYKTHEHQELRALGDQTDTVVGHRSLCCCTAGLKCWLKTATALLLNGDKRLRAVRHGGPCLSSQQAWAPLSYTGRTF